MKINLKASAIIMGAVLLFSGCSGSEGGLKPKSREIVSSNYKYKVDVPSDWEEVKQGDTLYDSDLFLQAVCNKRGLYMSAVVAEKQASFFGIDNFCNMVARELRNQYTMDFQDVKFEDVTINGVDMKFFEAQNVGVDSGESARERIWCYVRQVDEDYVGFVVETFEDKKADSKREEADMIISSYGKFVY